MECTLTETGPREFEIKFKLYEEEWRDFEEAYVGSGASTRAGYLRQSLLPVVQDDLERLWAHRARRKTSAMGPRQSSPKLPGLNDGAAPAEVARG